MDDDEYRYDPDAECPVCGGGWGQHERVQEVANEIRAGMGLPPLDPPDIRTGIQKR